MNLTKVTLLLCSIIAIACESENFIIGDGAGVFYKFCKTSNVVSRVNITGSIAGSFIVEFLPTSAALTANTNIAVVTGVTTSASNVIVTLNLLSGTTTSMVVTTKPNIIAAVKGDFVIVSSGNCYNKLSLTNNFEQSANTICIPTKTRLLGLLNNDEAALVTEDSAEKVGTINIGAFVDATIPSQINYITGTCNGSPFLASSGYIYSLTTSGLLTRYRILETNMAVSARISLDVSGQIVVGTDGCNSEIVTIVGTSGSGSRVVQFNLAAFATQNIVPLTISSNVLGLVNTNLGHGFNYGDNAIVSAVSSGNAVLLFNRKNSKICVASNVVSCNGVVTNANLGLSSSLNVCSTVNDGLNFGVSV
ncbi:hypothetical protein AKO1_006716 [Acrasis kona]|uniref:Uncharacterized protein n=1 Tax=Acrasis kona TaxID=1008807 RepID=A0AAW2ZIC5_9EUKA